QGRAARGPATRFQPAFQAGKGQVRIARSGQSPDDIGKMQVENLGDVNPGPQPRESVPGSHGIAESQGLPVALGELARQNQIEQPKKIVVPDCHGFVLTAGMLGATSGERPFTRKFEIRSTKFERNYKTQNDKQLTSDANPAIAVSRLPFSNSFEFRASNFDFSAFTEFCSNRRPPKDTHHAARSGRCKWLGLRSGRPSGS